MSGCSVRAIGGIRYAVDHGLVVYEWHERRTKKRTFHGERGELVGILEDGCIKECEMPEAMVALAEKWRQHDLLVESMRFDYFLQNYKEHRSAEDYNILDYWFKRKQKRLRAEARVDKQRYAVLFVGTPLSGNVLGHVFSFLVGTSYNTHMMRLKDDYDACSVSTLPSPIIRDMSLYVRDMSLYGIAERKRAGVV